MGGKSNKQSNNKIKTCLTTRLSYATHLKKKKKKKRGGGGGGGGGGGESEH